MKRTIAAVTSSRADFRHLFWPLREFAEDLRFANEIEEGATGSPSIIRAPAPEPALLDAAIVRLRAARTLRALLAAVRTLVCP